MLEFVAVSGAAPRSSDRVACCIVTRAGREKYLKRTLKALLREPVDVLLWANGPMEKPEGVSWFRSHPFNVGQHVAHNEMLDECVRRGYGWHIRVDDDCFMVTRKWLRKLLAVHKRLGRPNVVSVTVEGLDFPPASETAWEFASDLMVDQVDVLGGIFRMTPMSLMKDFRWDERQAMGFGDASQFRSYCRSAGAGMFRLRQVRATHGGSTQKQNEDAAWKIQHDMDQYMPLGL